MILVGGQLVAPPIAGTLLRKRLARDGRVISAHVSAFPWFELLWQHADSVSARLADYAVAPGHLRELLREAAGVGRLDIAIGVVHTGLLTLHDVSFSKHGAEMTAAAELNLADLQAALPIVRSLKPVQDANGRVVLRGSAGALGVNATVDVVVAARDGRLVAAPSGLLGALATVTLYDDPRIEVRSVDAAEVPGGVRFVVRGRLR